MKNKIGTSIVIFIAFLNLLHGQQHIVETTQAHATQLLKSYLPNYGAVLRLKNDIDYYASFGVAGSSFGNPLWIENQGPITSFFNGGNMSMSLRPNSVATQTGLVLGNTQISAGVTIDGVQNLLPPLESGVIVGTYQGPASDHSGILGVNRLQTGSGIGVKGKGGKIGTYGEVIVGNTGNDVYYGVYGVASTNGSGTAYAIYGDGDSYFDGDITVSGTIINPSDKKIKKNIKPMPGSLQKLLLLQAYTYEFKTDEYEYMHLSKETQSGFLSEDVAKIFPELTKKVVHKSYDNVSTLEEIAEEDKSSIKRSFPDLATINPSGFIALETKTNDTNTLNASSKTHSKNLASDEIAGFSQNENEAENNRKVEYTGVNYIGLIHHLVSGIQELDNENKMLKDRIIELEKKMNNVLLLIKE